MCLSRGNCKLEKSSSAKALLLPRSALKNQSSLPSPATSHRNISKKRRHSLTSTSTEHSSTSSSDAEMKPKSRHVAFAATKHQVRETILPPCSTMSPSEKAELWYSRENLVGFKKNAHQEGCVIRIAFSSNDDLLLDTENQDTKQRRDQEVHICFHRQRNRCIARKAVLQTQSRLQENNGWSKNSDPLDPSMRLALVSSKLTRWAREIALATGQNDFLAAYPELHSLVRPALSFEEINYLYPFLVVKSNGHAVSRERFLQEEAEAAIQAAKNKQTSIVTSSECPPSPSSVPDFTPGAIPTKLKNLTPEMMVPLPEEEDSDDEARRRLLEPKRRKISPPAAQFK